MKIAFCLFKYFPFGGLQNDFMDIARLCQTRGHQVVVYTCDWQGEQPDGFEIHQFTCKAAANYVKYQRYHRQVAAAMVQNPVDCVVGFNQMPGLDVYFASDPSYLQRQRNLLEKLTPRYRHFRDFEAAVFARQRSTRILVLSDAQQRDYQRVWNTPDERFVSIPPGIQRTACADEQAMQHRARIRAEFKLAEDDLLLLVIGSGFRTKGLDRTMLAIRSLPDDLLKRTQLVVIGQDKAAPFEKMALQQGLAGHVRILAGRDDIPAVMQAGEALLHPAYMEVAGKVILEAVVSGLPVIVTDVCGYAQHVAQANAGVVLPSPFSQDDLNRSLKDLLSGNKRQRWRENGLQYGQSQPLYAMAQASVDAIESHCRQAGDSG